MDSALVSFSSPRPGRICLTLIDFHIRNSLPLVHGHEPAILSSTTTAQVNDQLVLVSAERFQYRIQSRLAELTSWKEERCDDDLMR